MVLLVLPFVVDDCWVVVVELATPVELAPELLLPPASMASAWELEFCEESMRPLDSLPPPALFRPPMFEGGGCEELAGVWIPAKDSAVCNGGISVAKVAIDCYIRYGMLGVELLKQQHTLAGALNVTPRGMVRT